MEKHRQTTSVLHDLHQTSLQNISWTIQEPHQNKLPIAEICQTNNLQALGHDPKVGHQRTPAGFHPTNRKGSKSLWLLKPSWNFKPSEKEQFFPSPTPSLPPPAALALDSIFTCPLQGTWPVLQLSSLLPIVPAQHWQKVHMIPWYYVKAMFSRYWGAQK